MPLKVICHHHSEEFGRHPGLQHRSIELRAVLQGKYLPKQLVAEYSGSWSWLFCPPSSSQPVLFIPQPERWLQELPKQRLRMGEVVTIAAHIPFSLSHSISSAAFFHPPAPDKNTRLSFPVISCFFFKRTIQVHST